MSLRSVDLSPASWMAVYWSFSISSSLFSDRISLLDLLYSFKVLTKEVCLMFDDIRYPIYHIPMGRTIKDLSTCFLTYHTLSSSFQGSFFQLLCYVKLLGSKIFIHVMVVLQIWTWKMTLRILKGSERKEKASLFHHLAWPLTRCKETCGSRVTLGGTKRSWCRF